MATANATVRAVLDYLNEKSSSSVPTGAICYFATTAVPTGWLLCNGSNVSRTTYKALFAAIGTKFGTGNGSSTFTLPNLDERFIEGTTTTSDVGKKLEAGLPNITGETGGLVGYNELASGCFNRTNTGTATLPPGTLVTQAELNFSAQLSNPIYNGAITVQPSALFLLPCIKF